jgi:hypothetical protein
VTPSGIEPSEVNSLPLPAKAGSPTEVSLWEPGSIAFWDNRSTAHLAPRDIFDADFDRQFYRVTLVGDVPVGVDASPSKSIEGEPIVAQTSL